MGSRYFTVRLKKRPGKVRSSKSRGKTFDSEEKAKAWAKSNGIEKYSLENLKSPDSTKKKIRIVEG